MRRGALVAIFAAVLLVVVAGALALLWDRGSSSKDRGYATFGTTGVRIPLQYVHKRSHEKRPVIANTSLSFFVDGLSGLPGNEAMPGSVSVRLHLREPSASQVVPAADRLNKASPLGESGISKDGQTYYLRAGNQVLVGQHLLAGACKGYAGCIEYVYVDLAGKDVDVTYAFGVDEIEKWPQYHEVTVNALMNFGWEKK